MRPLSLSESKEIEPKLWAEELPVGERKDINIRQLVRYIAARAKEERLQTPIQRQIDENQKKSRQAEQLYGGYLVRLGAARAENKQTTTSNPNHNFFYGAKKM